MSYTSRLTAVQELPEIVNVNVEAPTFVPGFFGDPAGAQFGVEFYNNSIPFNSVSSISWDFGDGSTGVGSPVFHDYGVEGTFYVCQTVVNSLGCEKTTCDSIDVYDPSGILDVSEELKNLPEPIKWSYCPGIRFNFTSSENIAAGCIRKGVRIRTKRVERSRNEAGT